MEESHSLVPRSDGEAWELIKKGCLGLSHCPLHIYTILYIYIIYTDTYTIYINLLS